MSRIKYLLSDPLNGNTFDADTDKVCIRINDYDEVHLAEDNFDSGSVKQVAAVKGISYDDLIN